MSLLFLFVAIRTAGFARDREELDLAGLCARMALSSLLRQVPAHGLEQAGVERLLLRRVLQQRVGHGRELRVPVRTAQHVGNADGRAFLRDARQAQGAAGDRDLAEVEALARAA